MLYTIKIESVKFDISCLILKLEKGILSFDEFKKSIENYYQLNNDNELINIVTSKTANEGIYETYEYLKHSIDAKAFQIIIADIFTNNETKDLLIRIGDVINYYQEPINLEHPATKYLTENNFLKELYDFLYWSWDELNVTKSRVLSGLENLENDLNKLILTIRKFNTTTIQNWKNIENDIKNQLESIKMNRIK